MSEAALATRRRCLAGVEKGVDLGDHRREPVETLPGALQQGVRAWARSGPALRPANLDGLSTMIAKGDPLLDSARQRLLVASAASLTSDRRTEYLNAVEAEINQQTSFLPHAHSGSR